MRKQKRGQSAKLQPVPREVHGKIYEYERAVTSEAKISSHSLRFSKSPGTLSSYALPSFSHFVAHGRLFQKHVPH